MTKFKATYILAIFTFLVSSCNITKHVPDGKYLVKKNKISVTGDDLDEDALAEIIRQPANFKTTGLKLKLIAFNIVDSTRVAEKRIRKNSKIDRKNTKKRGRQERINEKRIKKARRKKQEYYTKKIIPLKDTLDPRLFIREWMKYKYGEPPVIFDSTAFEKTIDQHLKYLEKKGYYEGSTCGDVIYKRRKKVVIRYDLNTGPRLFIDSVNYQSDTPYMVDKFLDYLENTDKYESLKGKPFDRDILDDYRSKVAKVFRDDRHYGYSASVISYVVDTNNMDTHGVIVTMKFSDRVRYHPDYKDSLIYIKIQPTVVRNVYFHISDTTLFNGNFTDSMEALGLSPIDGQYINNLDTLFYNEIWDKKKDKLATNRMATFMFNEKMFVEPGVIESQNYLEQGEWYKEYYINRTYTRLLQLDLFVSIKPQIIDVFGTNQIDVHYYLVPAEKESFGFEPRATNSNGYFGATASIYYINNNLFGGAQKLRLSLTGGLESQPLVFDPTLTETDAGKLGRTFNTLELGPSFIFDVPGLFPTKITALSKKHRPRTVISGAYNYQRRTEFFRQTFQANYMWKMFVNKTQVFQYGLPMVSLIKFVNITKSADFENQLLLQNDLFLQNSYSDQFIWQDWKFNFEYKNVNKDDFNLKKNAQIYYNGSFDPAGNFLSLFQSTQDTNELGRYQIFGVPYSRFVRLDNDFIISKAINTKTSAHFRMLAGGGLPSGNKETSLPFDYSFFGGGSNDNRGWRARSLGPGVYKYMLDTNRTVTQIADIRLSASTEYRFSINSTLKGAVFLDAGNVWTARNDENRPGSQFTSDFYKQIAYSAGFGLRIDFDYFIIRFDIGIPLNNVSLPKDSRWIWNSRSAMIDELINSYGQETYDRLNAEGKIPSPFIIQPHFGIGYPF